MSKTPRNLLFLFSDQHAARVAGCYGDPLAETPALDALAARGVTFDAAICPSPMCVPSRMAMLTARHPHRIGVWGNEDVMHPGLPTMAHALGAAGLGPILVGRLHAVGPDQLAGYARREVGDHHANWSGVARVHMGPLEGTASPDRRSLVASGRGQSAYEVKDEDVTARALEVLDELAADLRAGRRERFALTVGFMLPHAPFVARAADFDRFAGRVGPARHRPPDPADEHPWITAWRAHRGILDVTEDEEIRARTAYYALCHSLDRMIGRVLDRLDALGLTDDTLVVYTSDHGEQIGEHGLWWKHTFHEDSVRVPLVMAWPGGLPAGERRGGVVNLTDVTATMLDAMGAPPIPDADGVSFWRMAQDGAAPWQDRAFSEYCQGSRFDWGIPGTTQNRMIRRGRWKLCYYHGHRPQLFDLRDDPGETRDLAGDPRHATLRDALTAEVLAGWDPVAIEAEIERNIARKALLRSWAEAVRPPSTLMWPMRPEHNRLDP